MTSEPIVSLRVHRVVSKKTENLDFLTGSEKDQFFSLTEEGAEQEELADEYASDWQLLSRSYGQVYLGEVFSFYAKVTNDSVTHSITDLSIRIDLQVTSRVINLCDTQRPALDAKQSVHLLMQHEIKEMGGNV